MQGVSGYRAVVESEDDWYIARALEDSGVFTQGRTLDEVAENIREVAGLLHVEKDVQVELVIPPAVKPKRSRRRRRQPARKQ